MNILLTNDDGVEAEGIKVLAKHLIKEHNVIVVAPSEQKSACSHSITIAESIKVEETKIEGVNVKAYKVSGTPADCVRIGLDKIIKEKIDIVISGINRGVNIGNDILYSGTVSAAIEGSIYNLPSMAVSLQITKGKDINYDLAADYALKVLGKSREKYLRNDVVLNLNIPSLEKEEIKGLKVCSIGNKIYDSYFVECIDDDGNKTFKLEGKMNDNLDKGTDIYYIKNKYVTLTPLHYDLTNFKILKETTNIFEKSN
ncbi:5'/3'-nucleotidase SurE [Clostridium oceanicum]|uniref:5'-nucleotidase SurE n=1 Tax=Clostridium oceanicum TaxID=1543 RepID=A0ABP3V075_9CLOT